MASLPIQINQSNPYEKIRPDNKRIARMQFPLDMGRYYIAFDFAEYGPSYQSGASDWNLRGNDALVNAVVGTVNGLTGSSLSPNAIRQQSMTYGIGGVDAQIALPLPPNLVDDQQLDYNAQNLLNVAAQAVSTVAGMAGSDAAAKAANALPALNDFQSIFTGKKVNPFLAMMFNGPRFKTHQFGWRFSPKNASESAAVVDIVNTFKKYSLPTQNSGIFTYPKVVLISLYPDEARNKMYKFKPSVITQTSVHYAPSGTPSFFAGSNAPVEIELKIQLSEISIWTSNDFVAIGDSGRL